MKNKLFILIVLIISVSFSSAQTINLTQMPLEEKLAQMFMVQGDEFHQEYVDMNIGGYFLNSQKSKKNYSELIIKYNNSNITPFFATDLEGYWNTLSHFYKSKSFGEIKNETQAYELGKSHAKVLKEIGFNWDFSPTVETKNKVWPGRSFNGTTEDIDKKITQYIKGLEKNGIIATAKHYPGGNLLKNPHIFKVYVTQENLELERFDSAISANVSSIMIGHTIVNKKQSTVDPKVIFELKEKFDGLIITDSISMWGLKISYLFREKKMIEDLIIAGNDIILYSRFSIFKPNPNKIQKHIEYLKDSLENEKISQKRIDTSVEKILEHKGYRVVY